MEQNVHSNKKEESIFETKKFGDLTIKIEGHELRAHRDILSLWSSVFKKMFESGMKESNSDHIQLDEENYEEFHTLLKVLYNNFENPITMENISFILRLADKFDIKVLNAACLSFLEKAPKSLEICLIINSQKAIIFNEIKDK